MATAQPPKRKVVAKKKSPATPLTREQQVEQTEKEYWRIAASPYFRDTLGVKAPVGSHWMGENNVYGYYDTGENHIYFNPEQPIKDMPSGGPMAGDKTARKVLTHEGGHSLENKSDFPSFYAVARPEFRVPLDESRGLRVSDALKSPLVERVMPSGFLDRLNMQDKTSLQPKKVFGVRMRDAFQPMPPSEVRAIQALDPYYAIGGIRSGEAVTDPSESFAQAYTNAAGFLSETAGDTTGFREKLGQYEGNTPGAGAIVRDLLTARPIYRQHPLRGVIR